MIRQTPLSHKRGVQPAPSGNGYTTYTTTTGVAIDIEQLTEKVYQLMQADIRLAQQRGHSPQRRKRM
jgi:hypothetical protein